MRSTAILTITVLALLTIAQPGCSKASPSSKSPASDSNPALPPGPAAVYQSIFRSFSETDLEALNNGELSQKALLAHRADIDKAIEASASPTCDFGVDWSHGMATVLPHNTYIRTTVRLLRADAERLIATGDLDGAAKRSAAILRIGQQLAASAHCAMEQLVACASIATGAGLVNDHPELARAAWKTDIQGALATVRQSGATWSTAALRGEGEMIARSLRNPTQIYLEDAAAMEEWKRKDQQEREQAAQKLLAIHAEIARVWEMSDAQARLDALGPRAASEGVGDFFVAASKVRNACTMAKQECAKAESALK